jgi:acyl-CoA thioester hydrolase
MPATRLVRSTVLEARGKVIRFAHEMRNAGTGEVSALTRLVGVHLDTLARKACPLPQAVADKASAFGAPMELPWND